MVRKLRAAVRVRTMVAGGATFVTFAGATIASRMVVLSLLLYVASTGALLVFMYWFFKDRKSPPVLTAPRRLKKIPKIKLYYDPPDWVKECLDSIGVVPPKHMTIRLFMLGAGQGGFLLQPGATPGEVFLGWDDFMGEMDSGVFVIVVADTEDRYHVFVRDSDVAIAELPPGEPCFAATLHYPSPTKQPAQ